MVGRLAAAIDEVAALDPDTLTDAELHDVVIDLVREDSRLAAARARLVAAWDARKGWAANGSKAAAARLMLDASVSRRTAKRELRRARALRTMPHTAAAVAEGKLSIDHAELLVHANQAELASLFQRDEQVLLDEIKALRHPAATRCVRYWQQLAHDEVGTPPSTRDRHGRHFSAARTLHGSVSFDGLVDSIPGSIVLNELARLEHHLFVADWADARDRFGDRATSLQLARTTAQRRADALVQMATRSAAMPADAVTPRPLVTVVAGYGAFSTMCELADGTVVAPHHVVPWLSDADIERIVFDGPSRVIDVGVRQRFFTGALRRAIEVRDRHCQHPSGCDVVAEDCQIDHIHRYADGGLTTQDNGRCHCATHNRGREHDRDHDPDDTS